MLVFGSFFSIAAWRMGAPFLPLLIIASLMIFPAFMLAGFLVLRQRGYELEVRKGTDGTVRIIENGRKESIFGPEAVFRHIRTSTASPHLLAPGNFRFGGPLTPIQREEILAWLDEGRETFLTKGGIRYR